MNLFKEYIRWRHSRGFGVHSPFAFRLISDVLRPGRYGYYSYWEIENHLKRNEKDDYRFIRLIKFTLRLAIFLKTRRIVSPSHSRIGEVSASSLGLESIFITKSRSVSTDTKSTLGFKFQESDLLIIEGSDLDISLVEKAVSRNVPIFAINPSGSLRKMLEKPLSHGLLFDDPSKMILIPRHQMAYVAYDIRMHF